MCVWVGRNGGGGRVGAGGTSQDPQGSRTEAQVSTEEPESAHPKVQHQRKNDHGFCICICVMFSICPFRV